MMTSLLLNKGLRLNSVSNLLIYKKECIDMSLLSRKNRVYYVVLEKPCGSIPNKCNARSNRSVVVDGNMQKSISELQRQCLCVIELEIQNQAFFHPMRRPTNLVERSEGNNTLLQFKRKKAPGGANSMRFRSTKVVPTRVDKKSLSICQDHTITQQPIPILQ